MAKFRKKPVVIEAVQLTEQACWDYWNNGVLVFERFPVSGSRHPETKKIHSAYLHIDTLEGKMRADLNDWIIKGVNEEFYPCKPDIFEKTYEAA